MNEVIITKASKSRASSFVERFLEKKWLYIFLLPGILYFAIFNYAPMYGVLIAFKKFDITAGIWASPFVGFENFQRLFASGDFLVIFKNSLLISFYKLAWGFPAPIILAIMLSEVRSSAYKRIVQTVIYLPHFISWVVLTALLTNFLSPSTGIINIVIRAFGGESIAFLQKSEWFRSILVSSEIWKNAGWGTIIYLAAISGIDPSLYESAIIDGAGRFRQIWHITLPSILGTVVVLLILNMGGLLRNGFEQVFMLYNPMVYEVADVFETFSYRNGIQEGLFDYATAIGLFQSVVGCLLVFMANSLSRKVGESSLW